MLVVSNLKHYGPDMVIALDPLSDDDLGFRKAVEEEPLRAEVIRMASTYRRYDYRLIASMMRNTVWSQASTAKVDRTWRQERLKILQKKTPRGRLWFSDGSCVRLRATHLKQVCSSIFLKSEMFMAARSGYSP